MQCSFLPLGEFAQFHLSVPCEIWNPPQDPGLQQFLQQAGGLPRNSPESKAGGKLDESKQAKAISDEQGGITGWGTTAPPSKHPSDGHHAQTDTAESSGKFPSTKIEISDSNQAGLTVPLLTKGTQSSPGFYPILSLPWGFGGFQTQSV